MLSFLATENKTIARAYGAISCLCFAVALFTIKICKTDSLSALWIRGFGGLFLSVWQIKSAGESVYPGSQKLFMTVLRSLCLTTAICITFIGVKLISITVWAILNRFQMITLYVASIFFMGIKFDKRVVYAAIISFFGATLVMAPSLYGFEALPGKSFELAWTATDILGVGLAMLWLLVDTTGFTIMTKISGGVSTGQSNFLLNIFLCFAAGLMIVIRDGKFAVYWDEVHYYILFVSCYFLGASLQFESSKVEKNMGIQAVLTCFFLLGSLFLEVFFLDTKLTLPNLCGCALVIGSSAWAVMLRSETTKN